MQSALIAISPIDGRYIDKVRHLSEYFSEYALFKYRVMVECTWYQSLATNPQIEAVPALSAEQSAKLESLYLNFSVDDAAKIKAIEADINHDVKAVEYFIKQQLSDEFAMEFIHFACTSEDINNLAYALMLKAAREDTLLPRLKTLGDTLNQFVQSHASQPMLARTHGQAASPTTLGKEFANVLARLQNQIDKLATIEIRGKMNGAVGNYNAHVSAYPEIDWPTHCQQFVEQLGLNFNPYTTQIEPHDYIAELCHAMMRINTIAIDFARDCWGYIALGYFRQQHLDKEVGSSTMPHKINPIDFENAEGNLGIANSLCQFFSEKLPISRWQRDLSDSTTLRNLGMAFAYSDLAYQSLAKGLSKLAVDTHAIESDLERHWDVLAEAIQTVMRRYGIEQPYEKLKSLTRGQTINQSSLAEFIQSLELPDSVKNELLALTPQTYIGYAAQLASKYGRS